MGDHWVEARQHYHQLYLLRGQAPATDGMRGVSPNPSIFPWPLWHEVPLRNTSTGWCGLWARGLAVMVLSAIDIEVHRVPNMPD